MAYTTEQIKQIIADAAARYGINPQLAFAQARQESGLNPNAQSGQGAQGLFQFIPGTWARYGSGNPFDPVASADAWGKYMSHLLSLFEGDYRLALAGYHSGEGAARAALNNPAGNPRTANYVNTIMGAVGGAVSDAASSIMTPSISIGGFQLSPLMIGGVLLVAFLVLK